MAGPGTVADPPPAVFFLASPIHLPFDFHFPTSIFTPTASEYEAGFQSSFSSPLGDTIAGHASRVTASGRRSRSPQRHDRIPSQQLCVPFTLSADVTSPC